MKKILITGADGFIGSHLTEFFLKKKYDVNVLVQYNSFGHNGWLDTIELKKKRLKIFSGDIRDHNYCLKITKNIDFIINLAALISIPYSYQSVSSFLDTNLKGTMNICEAALVNKVKKIIQFSTSEVYGSAIYKPIDENHPLQPQSPYSASKIASDSIALSYFYSYNLGVTIARPFNTYGPRQSSRAIIPTIINQMLLKKKKINLGNIKSKRDFLYVGDLCEAIFLLVKNYKKFNGQTFNIGSQNFISIKNLFKKIRSNFNHTCRINTQKKRLRPIKSEVNELYCNSNKIKKLLKFRPVVNLPKGLSLTIDWYKINFNHFLLNTKKNKYLI